MFVDFLRRSFDLLRISDIGRERDRFTAQSQDISFGTFKTRLAARDESNARTFTRESLHGRASHPGGGAGNDDCPFIICIVHIAKSRRRPFADAFLWEAQG
jgi:hypothetical protein